MATTVHGHNPRSGDSHEYRCWMMMKQRCLNPKRHNYKWYGGRGVQIAEQWLTFAQFLADMGLAPSAKHSLDRFPNGDGNYEPGNVRWANQQEQFGKTKSAAHRAALSLALTGKPKSAAHRAALSLAARRKR